MTTRISRGTVNQKKRGSCIHTKMDQNTQVRVSFMFSFVHCTVNQTLYHWCCICSKETMGHESYLLLTIAFSFFSLSSNITSFHLDFSHRNLNLVGPTYDVIVLRALHTWSDGHRRSPLSFAPGPRLRRSVVERSPQDRRYGCLRHGL